MSTTMHELEGEFSPLHEGPPDQFIGAARRLLRRLPIRNILRTIAPHAARVVLGAIPGVGPIAAMAGGALVRHLTREQQEQMEAALHELASGEMGSQEFGEAYEMAGAHEFGTQEFGGSQEMAGTHEFGLPESVLGEFSGEAIHEFGGQGEWEGESELNGAAANGEALEWEMHPEGELGLGHSEAVHNEAALMEMIAHEAASAHNAVAAEALAGSLVPIAARLARAGAPALRRATPALAMAAGRLAGTLRRSPATRPLVRVLPYVLTQTARSIARSAAQGRPVTPQQAVRAMAGQTYRVFNTPEVSISILIRGGRRRRRQFRRAAF